MKVVGDKYFKISNHQIYFPNIKKKIKIVATSDIHISKMVQDYELNGLVEKIKKQKPNYIFILGDIIDDPYVLKEEKQKEKVISLFERLRCFAKVIFILGNHDFIHKNNKECYDESFWNYIASLDNVEFLKNSIYKDENIFVYGHLLSTAYYIKYHHKEDIDLVNRELNENLIKEYPNLYKIGLFHSPEFQKNKELVKKLEPLNICISGHMHAGCVPAFLDKIFPKYAGIISPKKHWFPNYVRGLFNISDNTKLLVGGGFEKITLSAPKIIHPLNHLCYKEIDVIEISNNKKDDTTINIEKY